MIARRRVLLAALIATLVSACSGPILANPTTSAIPPPTGSPAPSTAPDPQPITFPPDDAAHHRLTEWWYYTGHLVDADGHHWGFEFVVFRAERGGFPVTWASHLALTDESAGTFSYAQRAEIGPQVDQSPPGGAAFAFEIRGALSAGAGAAAPAPTPWTMSNAVGPDRLQGALDDGTTLDLSLVSTKPPALHGDNGWIDFGPAGGSYYYSRTRLDVSGSMTVGGRRLAVTGEAWFDHQWGDFISVGGGGWDWFAINLDGGTDLTLSLVRAADGSFPLVYGTLVGGDGSVRHLAADDFTVTSTGTWTSPHTGAKYPAGWQITVHRQSLICDLTMDLTPTVADQELDTRASTGVVYWEGSQRVAVTPCGEGDQLGGQLGGEAYVELTGYGSAKP